MPAATTRPARTRINVNDAWCEALFALLSLDLMFRALGYQPGFAPLVIAYAAANLASAVIGMSPASSYICIGGRYWPDWQP